MGQLISLISGSIEGNYLLSILPVRIPDASIEASSARLLVFRKGLHQPCTEHADGFRVLDIDPGAGKLVQVQRIDIRYGDVVLNHPLNFDLSRTAVSNIVALRFSSNLDGLERGQLRYM